MVFVKQSLKLLLELNTAKINLKANAIYLLQSIFWDEETIEKGKGFSKQ